MVLMPKRMKYRKSQRGRIHGDAHRGNKVVFGDYGLMSLESGWVTGRELEAARVSASHFLGRQGKLFRRVFPWKPISAKPLETRMGKGKGEVAEYVAVVRPGLMLYEIGGVDATNAKQALARMAHKFSVKCKMVNRRPTI